MRGNYGLRCMCAYHHGERLSTTRLTIREDSAVVTIEDI